MKGTGVITLAFYHYSLPLAAKLIVSIETKESEYTPEMPRLVENKSERRAEAQQELTRISKY